MSTLKRFKASKLIFTTPIIFLISDIIIPYSREIHLFVTFLFFIGSLYAYNKTKIIIYNNKYIIKNNNLSIIFPKIEKISKNKITEYKLNDKILFKFIKIKYIEFKIEKNSKYNLFFYR
ncbi:hypothetical protein [Silvanigrella sp.]|jgi:hypothetical protein|uniref:hypothetical protein n=1 Tax=Silvanigrella sp. TaxID=2024976 RepID=UPI0037CC1F17|nr:hypothetical protein [Silvanigrellaceae bacterium]